jgi:hypothetical protein
MGCIFGFGYHDTFCPCELVTIKDPDVVDIVCDFCERKLRCAYRKERSCDTFEDYLLCRIDEELHNILNNFPHTCGYGLTKEEYDTVSINLNKICDGNMTYS